MRWGIELPDTGMALPEAGDFARRLEAAGFECVWAGETAANESMVVLSVLAAATRELRVGPAVLPVFTRTPGLLAMSAATLARAFPGRVSIGIGASSAFVVERWNGIPFRKPFARVRDTLRFLQAALRGERITHEYDSFSIRGFQLPELPEEPPPLLVGATGPRMLDFALKEADGVILNWLSAADIARIEGLPAQRDRAFGLVSVIPSDDREQVYAQARPYIAQYLSVPAYAGQQRRFGRGDRLAEVWAAWAERDYKKAAAALPTDVIDELLIHGPPEACRERIAEFARVSGVTPLVIPMGEHAPFQEIALSLGPETR